MDIENTKSCIISGHLPAKKVNRQIEKKETEPEIVTKVDKKDVKKIKIGFRLPRLFPGKIFEELKGVIRSRSRKFMAVTAGAAVFLAGAGALGTYCTVGVDYYYGDRLLCTVAAADDSAAIIGAAVQRADLMGAQEPEIQTSAKLTLKKDLVDGDEAIDAILAASPDLCRGYVVCVSGSELFVSDDREAVNAVLKEYVDKYAIDGSAHLSGEVEFREQIVRKDEVISADKILSLLEDGGVVTVVSTVDETQSQIIPFEIEEISDDTMYVGDSIVETPGVEGSSLTTVESIYQNGVLLSAAILDTETLAEPVTQVVRVGTKPRNALTDGLSYPVSGSVLTSNFGQRWGRQHQGVDLAVSTGTQVMAAAAGTVITAKYSDGYGNYVQIDHGYGIVTTYAHLNSITVSVGQSVDRGELIAYSGNTGNSTGPHLHFEVINNGEYLNPLNYLQ